MAHESFEDPEIAALMNERFVCIKVDREERPDVDAICMEACQAITGHGGWPLNAFLTPEQAPFYAGTYFPPESRHGLPSWRMVLDAIADAWQNKRDQILAAGRPVRRDAWRDGATGPVAGGDRRAGADRCVVHARRPPTTASTAASAARPKFPPASTIELLLSRGEHEMSLGTLRSMAQGGIYDQIGGGFARYSVDATWTVPHFEKMLYDNALLARAYLHGWQESGDERLRRVCCETLDWALREMRGPEGGFCAALDADSEGVEGKFYVWTEAELRDALGELYDDAVAYFRPVAVGGRGWSSRAADPSPRRCRRSAASSTALAPSRVRPGLDDKRLTSWNALMVAALADAGAVLERDDYLEAAVACASFLLSELRDDDGRLLRTWKDGQARLPAYLEDHAYLLEALLTLYESTFDPRWYREAVALGDTIIERFSDPERGGFFTTADDHERLAARRKDLEDTPIPSGNSAAAFGLLRLALLSGEGKYERHALGVLRLLYRLAVRHPHAFGHLLRAADFYLAPVREVAIVGPDSRCRWSGRRAQAQFRPHLVLAGGVAAAIATVGRRAAARGPRAGRRPRRGVRVRALRLPGAGDRRARSSRRRSATAPAGSARAPTE